MTGFFAAGQWWDVSTEDDALIKNGVERLTVVEIPNALAEARALFAAVFPQDYVDNDDLDDRKLRDRYLELINRRADREPFSHLVGYRDFYNHRFRVTPDVLDPRPDTETLVAEALKETFSTVLDLGTGSGCILLSILAEHPTATGVGTDVSAAALDVARWNADTLDLKNRATFIPSDWFDAVHGTYDLIVSNPPYIAVSEMADLQPEVRDHEPRLALTDEADGLTSYRRIIADAPTFLTDAGHLMVEIGPTQSVAVARMMRQRGFAAVTVTRDLDGRDRVVSGRKDA